MYIYIIYKQINRLDEKKMPSLRLKSDGKSDVVMYRKN